MVSNFYLLFKESSENTPGGEDDEEMPRGIVDLNLLLCLSVNVQLD